MEWYKLSLNQVQSELDSDCESGLSHGQAQERLEKHGYNQLEEEAGKSFLHKLKEQLSDFLVLILMAAALVSFFVGEKTDSIVILAIVIVNAFLGIYQEGKAEKSLAALKEMASPTAKVIRNNHLEIIPASNLVPGDLVCLEAGDIVPADLRLTESMNLKVEEASLTGESLPVSKDWDAKMDQDTALGDRKNMAYTSTIVSYGRGKGLVVETSYSTEIGKIASAIQTYDSEETPLQKQLNQLGKYLGLITILICFIVFIIGLVQDRGFLDMLMVAISLAVAAIPEGLPAIVTIVLALGMNKMVKRHAIVKKLLAVETLGSTSVICSDKTGTLTQNEMTVVKAYSNNEEIRVEGIGYEPVGSFHLTSNNERLDGKKDLERLLAIGLLSNNAELEKDEEGYSIIGDPTEGALVSLAAKADMLKADYNRNFPRIEEIPFESSRKMMTSFHENYIEDRIVSFTKGAPDIVIDRCDYIYLNGQVLPLDKEKKEKILQVNSSFSRDALRVLALAYREYESMEEDISSENIENKMIFVGLLGMIDPPRLEAKDSIDLCKKAGIRTLMITGDHRDTAFAIARDLGIAQEEGEVIVGPDLDKLTDEDLARQVEKISVYARVSPEHKVRIISALKANGHIVAMTGDGVNDAMALKKADIGVAMGITGTDVAKNTSDLILTDDNFSSIVAAVEEGRVIYDNIRKFVYFLLSCNIGEILLVFVSMLIGLPVPLLPIQLLWLNLVTDSFPALALGVEEGDPDIMDYPPRDPKEALLNRDMIIRTIIQSIAIGVSTISVYLISIRLYPGNLDMARTITFVTLIMAELLRAYSSRSQKHSLFETGIFTNRTLIYGTGFSFLLTLLVLYIPVLQPIFDTLPLALKQWSLVLPFSFIPLIVGELYKYLTRRKPA